MSDEGSPNLQKLRDFRLQKKPQLTHNISNELNTCKLLNFS